MILELSKEKSVKLPLALNILLFKTDEHDFIRIIPAIPIFFMILEEGYYKLIFFFPGSEYAMKDSLFVREKGTNYFAIDEPEQLRKDSFSIGVSKIIEENLFKPKTYIEVEQTEVKPIQNAYRHQFPYTGEGFFVEGIICDNDGERLPGVTVVVKGTTIGTVTDLEGHYSLKVPFDHHELIISYIGYVQQELDIDYENIDLIVLTEDVLRLEEVVVVGYGTQKKMNLTGSISVVNTTGVPAFESSMVEGLQGRVSGVSISRSGAPGNGVNI